MLDFWNVNFGVYYKLEKKLISKQTWFFVEFELDFYCLCSLQKLISKSNWFFDFLNLIFRNWKKLVWHSIFQKSSGDRQGVSLTVLIYKLCLDCWIVLVLVDYLLKDCCRHLQLAPLILVSHWYCKNSLLQSSQNWTCKKAKVFIRMCNGKYISFAVKKQNVWYEIYLKSFLGGAKDGHFSFFQRSCKIGLSFSKLQNWGHTNLYSWGSLGKLDWWTFFIWVSRAVLYLKCLLQIGQVSII